MLVLRFDPEGVAEESGGNPTIAVCIALLAHPHRQRTLLAKKTSCATAGVRLWCCGSTTLQTAVEATLLAHVSPRCKALRLFSLCAFHIRQLAYVKLRKIRHPDYVQVQPLPSYLGYRAIIRRRGGVSLATAPQKGYLLGEASEVRRAVLLLTVVVAVVLLASGVGLAQSTSTGPTFVTEWGGYGREDGQFRQPLGVASDASGNIYIADRNNQRIQKFDPDGEFITKWGIFGDSDGDFLYPIEVAADASGNVYVVDQKSPRIQKFDSEGNFVTMWGDYGRGDGEFHLDYRFHKGPAGVA